MIDLKIKRGMNFDHHVDVPGQNLAQEKYFKLVKDAGFDHVRLPFNFSLLRPGIFPCDEYYERIKGITQMALDAGLAAIVDCHPFEGMQGNPHGTKKHLYKMWGELSDALKDMDERVIFEMYNEPDGPFDFAALNEIQNELISIIRKTNPTRLLAAATAHCNTIENLINLELPRDDENIFVTIHEYTPMKFTHQGADWMAGDWPIGVRWGTEAERNFLTQRFDMAAQWAKENNRRLHLGEFGAMANADPAERAAWTRHVIRLAEERNMAWSYWDFCYSFGVYDINTDQWNKELLDVLQNP